MVFGLLQEVSFISFILLALLKCLRNIMNPALWYSVLVFFFMAIVVLAILYAVQYIGGGLGYIVNQVIHALNKVRHFFKHNAHDWDSEVIDSLSGLVDGSCDPFKHASSLMRYGMNKLFSAAVCEKLRWYESITLTRIFVAKPVKALFTDTSMLQLHSCSMRKSSEFCAWIVGTEHVLKFMIKKGMWILVAIHILFPFISLGFKLLRYAVQKCIHKMYTYIRRIMPKLHVNQTKLSIRKKWLNQIK